MAYGTADIEADKRRRMAAVLQQMMASSQQVGASLQGFADTMKRDEERKRLAMERDREFTRQTNRDAEDFRHRDFQRQASLREAARADERDQADRDFRERDFAARTNAEGERFRTNDFARQAEIREQQKRERDEGFKRLQPSVEAHAREMLDPAVAEDPGMLQSMAERVVRDAAKVGLTITDEEARDKLSVEIERLRRLDEDAARRQRESEARAAAFDRRGRQPRGGSRIDEFDRRQLAKIRDEETMRLRQLKPLEVRLARALDEIQNRGALEAARWGDVAGLTREEIAAQLQAVRGEIEGLGDPARRFGERIRALRGGTPLQDILDPAPPPAQEPPPAQPEDPGFTMGEPQITDEQPGVLTRFGRWLSAPFRDDDPAPAQAAPAAAPAAPAQVDVRGGAARYASLSEAQKAQVDPQIDALVEQGVPPPQAIAQVMARLGG